MPSEHIKQAKFNEKVSQLLVTRTNIPMILVGARLIVDVMRYGMQQ